MSRRGCFSSIVLLLILVIVVLVVAAVGWGLYRSAEVGARSDATLELLARVDSAAAANRPTSRYRAGSRGARCRATPSTRCSPPRTLDSSSTTGSIPGASSAP